jgi:hypothetical protein
LETKTCPACRTVNTGSAVVCVRCGARIGEPVPPPAAPAPPLGAGTGDPPPNPVGTFAETLGSVPPTWSSLPPVPAPTPTRRPLLLVSVVVALVVLAVAGVTLLGGHGAPSFPDTLGGQPRATGGVADQVESALSDYKVQGMTVDVALYGPEQDPSVMLMLIEGAPDVVKTMSRDEFFDTFSTGFASGFAGATGQRVDFTTGLKETRGDADYLCAASSATVGATSSGAVCVFRGDVLGVLLTSSTSDTHAAVDLAEEAYTALT